jgi:hypothetical protein
MALDAAQANSMLDYMHGRTTARVITGSRLRLLTAIGTAGAAGTEVAAGGGYVAAAGGTPATAGIALTWGTAATAQSIATTAIAQVTNYPRAETVTAVEVWSTDATALRVEFGALTASKLMAAGDTLSFAVGAISSALT